MMYQRLLSLVHRTGLNCALLLPLDRSGCENGLGCHYSLACCAGVGCRHVMVLLTNSSVGRGVACTCSFWEGSAKRLESTHHQIMRAILSYRCWLRCSHTPAEIIQGVALSLQATSAWQYSTSPASLPPSRFRPAHRTLCSS